MSCNVCNQECSEGVKRCTHCQEIMHLTCIRDEYNCKGCSQPLSFTVQEFEQLEDNESDDSDDGIEEAMSRILDQSQIPEVLRNKRIEHKIICVGPTGTPQVTIITIPRKIAPLYLDKLFRGLTPLGAQGVQQIPQNSEESAGSLTDSVVESVVESVVGIPEPLITDLYAL